MNLRRVPAVVIVLASVVALIVLGTSDKAHVDPVFTALGAPTEPFVPKLDFVTSSWFCPGAPAAAAAPGATAPTGASVVIANPGDTPLSGQVTVFTDALATSAIAQPFEVKPRDTAHVDLASVQPGGTYTSALVEISGGGGFVEQWAPSASGSAVAPCANSTSSSWYFADGFTNGGSTEDIVVTNPFPDDAILNFQLATTQGTRRPASLQGYPVRGRSISVVKIATIVRDDPAIAVQITSTRGRVVAGRAQVFAGPARAGFTMTLGAPSLADQYYFAAGEKGAGISERYTIYNGAKSEVTLQAVFLGLPPDAKFANDDPHQQITLKPGAVTTLDTADVAALPPGRHGAVFSTFTPDSIVVERAITRPAGDGIATSVVLGQPSRFATTRWSMAIGSQLPLDNVLVVLNADNVDAVVTVKVLGPGGEVAVPGMESIALPANTAMPIAVTDPTALGRPLVVESTQRIFVERLLPRDPSLRGRSGSFALPG